MEAQVRLLLEEQAQGKIRRRDGRYAIPYSFYSMTPRAQAVYLWINITPQFRAAHIEAQRHSRCLPLKK